MLSCSLNRIGFISLLVIGMLLFAMLHNFIKSEKAVYAPPTFIRFPSLRNLMTTFHMKRETAQMSKPFFAQSALEGF